jgi:hypothetical protein
MSDTDIIPISSARLARCEAVIEHGLKSFFEAGEALREIHDDRLYLQCHPTFEEYCRERWKMSRVHAYRLMQSAAVTRNLLPMGNIIPASERQIRSLVQLQPEEQIAAWNEAVEEAHGLQPTGREVERAVKKRYTPEPILTDEAGWSEDERARREKVEAGITVVANLRGEADKHLINWARSKGLLVLVDRSSEWGNPFRSPRNGDRDTVCDLYALYCLPPTYKIPFLKGKVLACWCYPERCHGDYLAELANSKIEPARDQPNLVHRDHLKQALEITVRLESLLMSITQYSRPPVPDEVAWAREVELKRQLTTLCTMLPKLCINEVGESWEKELAQ